MTVDCDCEITQLVDLYSLCAGGKKRTVSRDTYLWRSISTFWNKMSKLGVSLDTTKLVLCHLMRTRKRRGHSFLVNDKTIAIGIEETLNELKQQQQEIETVRRSHRFAAQHDFKFGETDGNDAYPNLVIWYVNRRLSATYVALSEGCDSTMRSLPPDERRLLPPKSLIQYKRMRFIVDNKYGTAIKNIMGNDTLKISGSDDLGR